MKKVYTGRIIGFGFLTFILGALGFAKFGPKIIWLSFPFILLWLFEYDLSKYEAMYGRGELE